METLSFIWYNFNAIKSILNKMKRGFHMYYSTTDTYQIKRSIFNFTSKLTKKSGQVSCKFVSDMVYGIIKKKDVKLSSISDA